MRKMIADCSSAVQFTELHPRKGFAITSEQKPNHHSSTSNFALAPGAVYTNETEAVEWIVPRSVMTQLVIATEGL